MKHLLGRRCDAHAVDEIEIGVAVESAPGETRFCGELRKSPNCGRRKFAPIAEIEPRHFGQKTRRTFAAGGVFDVNGFGRIVSMFHKNRCRLQTSARRQSGYSEYSARSGESPIVE
jgi:hypothetical protein